MSDISNLSKKLSVQEINSLQQRLKTLQDELKKLTNDQNGKKLQLNGTFGKLGNRYSSFYSPDLMLAVTITGQLNLMCLVHELEKLPDTRVISANTDGIMVHYPHTQRDAVLAVIEANSRMTEFEYEETPYKLVAMKDVNNYVAITTSNEVKAKGLYASNREEENPLYLMKNPAMEVCCRMMKDYLLYGWLPEDSIREYTDPTDYMACRVVKGGGVQHTHIIEVDDWELIEDYGSAQNVWWSEQLGKKAKRKSRPKPGMKGVGGTPFGRVARWYMSTRQQPPLTYVSSGNKVPDTDGAQLCLTLPETLPDDLDRDWYIKRTYSMLADVGVEL